MKTPSLETLALRSTPLHRLEPRVKLVWAVLTCAALATAPRVGPWGVGLLCLPVVAAFVLGQVPARAIGRGMVAAAPFWLLLVLPAPFLEPGRTVYEGSLGGVGFTVTAEGVALAATLLGKFAGAIGAVLALMATTPFAQLVDALGRLGVPRVLLSVVSLTYRYLFVLADEARRLLRARRSRAPRARIGVGGAARLLSTLLVRALERAERIHLAMLSRGFEGGLPTLEGRRPRAVEIALGLVVVGALVTLWWLARALACGGEG